MDRLLGLLLFLPVPLVLWLFTRQPLGPLSSVALGAAVMMTHGLYARPFARGRAGRRCLWCGGPAGSGPALTAREPLGATSWRACGEAHARSLSRTLGWAAAHRRLLQAGVGGSLLVFLLLTVAIGTGVVKWFRAEDAVALFRLGVGLTVLPLGFVSTALGPAQEEPRVPFPLHIQALLGTSAVLWLFRLVGLWWLATGAWGLGRLAGV